MLETGCVDPKRVFVHRKVKVTTLMLVPNKYFMQYEMEEVLGIMSTRFGALTKLSSFFFGV